MKSIRFFLLAGCLLATAQVQASGTFGWCAARATATNINSMEGFKRAYHTQVVTSPDLEDVKAKLSEHARMDFAYQDLMPDIVVECGTDADETNAEIAKQKYLLAAQQEGFEVREPLFYFYYHPEMMEPAAGN